MLLTKLEIALALALLFVGSVCIAQDATIQKQKALIRQMWGDCGSRGNGRHSSVAGVAPVSR